MELIDTGSCNDHDFKQGSNKYREAQTSDGARALVYNTTIFLHEQKAQITRDYFDMRGAHRTITFSILLLLTATPPLKVSSLTTMHFRSASVMEGPKGSNRGTMSYRKEGLISTKNSVS